MFGNVPNNNSNRQSVNTRSVVLYGELSCLTITWWDDKMSLKINPLLNVDSEGKRNYDTEKRVTTALTQVNAATLHSLAKTELLPVICDCLDNKKNLSELKSVMFPVGVSKKNAVGIELRPSDKNYLDTYLVLYNNIKDDNTCNEKYEYKFNQISIVKDYDAEKGTGKEDKYEGEFLLFVNLLETVIIAISPVAHEIKCDNANSKRYNNGNNGGGYNNNYNNNNNYNQPAPTSNIDDEDDLPF